jgi:uncharacterized membrane protein YedE/YeeE
VASDRYDDEFDDRPRRRRGGGDPAAGRELVRGPGLALLLYGLLCLVLNLGSLALFLVSPDTVAKPYHNWMAGLLKDMPKQPGQPDPLPPYDEFKQQMVMQSVIGGVIGLVVTAVILLAAVKLRAARAKGLAMTGSILAMTPLSACCLLGLPIGIWCVVVMGKPDVKAAFAAAPRPTFDDLDDRS